MRIMNELFKAKLKEKVTSIEAERLTLKNSLAEYIAKLTAEQQTAAAGLNNNPKKLCTFAMTILKKQLDDDNLKIEMNSYMTSYINKAR